MVEKIPSKRNESVKPTYAAAWPYLGKLRGVVLDAGASVQTANYFNNLKKGLKLGHGEVVMRELELVKIEIPENIALVEQAILEICLEDKSFTSETRSPEKVKHTLIDLYPKFLTALAQAKNDELLKFIAREIKELHCQIENVEHREPSQSDKDSPEITTETNRKLADLECSLSKLRNLRHELLLNKYKRVSNPD